MIVPSARLGLIINPVAGLGGTVGLKGSDGADVQKKALEMGAVPHCLNRAVRALERIATSKASVELITCAGRMGQDAAEACGLDATVVGSSIGSETTAEHTRNAAREMKNEGVKLLMFAGGDGTARDVHDAINSTVTVLGIPAGVKIHSGVYAISPAIAGELAAEFLTSQSTATTEAEVMDIDEEALRDGRITTRLYGYMKIPRRKRLTQGVKASTGGGSAVVAAADVARKMEPDRFYIVGPGTTTRSVMAAMDLSSTLIGVDIVKNSKLVAADVNEQRILETITGHKASIVVTAIGGQGYLFGRGNQQISAAVINEVGKDNITVVASKEKLISFEGEPLLVDTGNDDVDHMLAGYVRVVTGNNEQSMYRIIPASEVHV